MNLFIVYNSQSQGELFQKKKFAFSLRGLAVNDVLIRHSDKAPINISGHTNAQLNSGFRIYGFHKGVRTFDKGNTVRWDIPRQRITDNKWVIEWHQDFDSIPGPHTTEEYDINWFDQIP